MYYNLIYVANWHQLVYFEIYIYIKVIFSENMLNAVIYHQQMIAVP